ncbi:MAG: DUF4258 domain-containing protein [Candidatus Omnitrophota bacterium]
MPIDFHPHAYERMEERGANKEEVYLAITRGECFPAKFGRMGFRHNFSFENYWRGKYYHTKQIEAYCVKQKNGWLVLTVVTRYF